MITRKVRENLLRVAESEFMNLKEDLLNGDVIDMAVRLYGILNLISVKYTNDAIVELIPELSLLLNKLDTSMKINSDLSEQLVEINRENSILKNKIEEEKIKAKVNLEESLYMEEMIETELEKLKTENRSMKEENKVLKEEIKSRNELVSALVSDYEKITQECYKCKEKTIQHRNHTEPKSHFITPKKVVKQREKTKQNVEISNQYSVLAHEDVLSTNDCRIQTKAQVHRSDCLSPPKGFKSDKKQHKKIRNKIVVLSDSQGKNLHNYIQNITEDYEVFVYTKPGARLKDIIQDSKCFIEECSKDDFVVLLAGTNDIGKCQPSQLSIMQGLNALLSLDVNTNVIINSVPYRFDTMKLNDNIFYANMAITRIVRQYKGPLSVSYGDLNAILRRNHFTRHGLHINRAGKRVLGKNIVQTIDSRVRTTSLPPEVVKEDNWRGLCRGPESGIHRQRTGNQARDMDLSLIEPYPSPDKSAVQSFSDDGLLTTSLRNFPPLPLSTNSLQLCNISSDINSQSHSPMSNDQSSVFLAKIVPLL